uniref:Uncharacterized protein n=1 Tax=Siphoviridae sp. ctLqe90 TaxID=2825456 RepID=A0A8S5Q3A4_9CAUD|nr:MAG TPA: hypothetical protein [Siphoviridae sp. ctLqe90]DAG36094.1 MAG TPA: hypothetical protein [Caudoviricetes sp.]
MLNDIFCTPCLGQRYSNFSLSLTYWLDKRI